MIFLSPCIAIFMYHDLHVSWSSCHPVSWSLLPCIMHDLHFIMYRDLHVALYHDCHHVSWFSCRPVSWSSCHLVSRSSCHHVSWIMIFMPSCIEIVMSSCIMNHDLHVIMYRDRHVIMYHESWSSCHHVLWSTFVRSRRPSQCFVFSWYWESNRVGLKKRFYGFMSWILRLIYPLAVLKLSKMRWGSILTISTKIVWLEGWGGWYMEQVKVLGMHLGLEFELLGLISVI